MRKKGIPQLFQYPLSLETPPCWVACPHLSYPSCHCQCACSNTSCWCCITWCNLLNSSCSCFPNYFCILQQCLCTRQLLPTSTSSVFLHLSSIRGFPFMLAGLLSHSFNFLHSGADSSFVLTPEHICLWLGFSRYSTWGLYAWYQTYLCVGSWHHTGFWFSKVFVSANVQQWQHKHNIAIAMCNWITIKMLFPLPVSIFSVHHHDAELPQLLGKNMCVKPSSKPLFPLNHVLIVVHLLHFMLGWVTYAILCPPCWFG